MGVIKKENSKIGKAKISTNRSKITKAYRSKMPRFSDIHRKQFKNMESIGDYVARKKKRAEELTKSTIKKSVKKSPLNKEMCKQMVINPELKDESSKARQKIDFTKCKISTISKATVVLKNDKENEVIKKSNLPLPVKNSKLNSQENQRPRNEKCNSSNGNNKQMNSRANILSNKIQKTDKIKWQRF